MYLLLTTNARLAEARLHALHKSRMRDVGRSKKKSPLRKKINKNLMILKLEEKTRWSFLPYPTFLNQSTQTKN